MNDTQKNATQKLLDELHAVRNALEAWRDHGTDPREALASYTKPDGSVEIGTTSLWGEAMPGDQHDSEPAEPAAGG